ncbi:acyl-CoA dehydrogenase family protein [Bacillus sp. MRMR6]|uniref:acyl-CoA dehydrogenase family protein n=1 Tax=Bacillus sp. MRMR6 TaxID=1928617 RepID=UPI000952D99A|nr:acyl-CoA dehydrogenase family protein [Bacillus sp. MRMR6]OLS36179.1 acyl-CoA dehydrogenase [Bacillus sp. MRMR6]
MSGLPYTREHEIFRKSVQKFLEKEAVPYFDEWEQNKCIPKSFWKRLGEQGYLCPWVEEEYGGLGTDFYYSVIIYEEFEKIASGLSGIGLHSDIVMPYIHSFGNEHQKQRWLPPCINGDIISAIAMTEPGAGSDLAGIKTTAKKDADDYIINGEKTFITNGYTADLVIVVCKTNPNANPPHRGISLFVVEEGTPGFSKGKKLKKMGQHVNDTCELIFEDVRVSKEHLLGEEGKGFYYLMQKLQQERLLCALGGIVSAEEMLRMTIGYTKQREAFGKNISQFQNTQFELAEMATEIKIGRTFVDDLINNHVAGKNVVNEVSMAKWWVTDLAKKTAGRCMQLHGGYGYMEEYEIARRYRDIAVTSIYAGTNEIMKNIIAKNMGL